MSQLTTDQRAATLDKMLASTPVGVRPQPPKPACKRCGATEKLSDAEGILLCEGAQDCRTRPVKVTEPPAPPRFLRRKCEHCKTVGEHDMEVIGGPKCMTCGRNGIAEVAPNNAPGVPLVSAEASESAVAAVTQKADDCPHCERWTARIKKLEDQLRRMVDIAEGRS